MASLKRHKAADAEGKVIRQGDRVRVLGMPDLSGMGESGRVETQAVFKHLIGTVKRISGFDQIGNAEFTFRILSGKRKGLHITAIEPSLLKKVH